MELTRATSPGTSLTGGAQVGPVHTNARARGPSAALLPRIDSCAHGPAMHSVGGMSNLARTEMSRDPLVWWSFAAAFGFMVTLVLAANLFADGVRDAFDPRARSFRPKLRKAIPT